MPGPTVNVNITASISKLRANLASASSLIRDWSLLATGLGSGVTTAFKNIANVGMVAAKAGIVSLAGAFIATTKVTADFEEQINRTFAIIRRGAGASANDLDGLRQEALRLGKDTLISATNAAEGMQLLARAGFDAKQVMASLQPAINLSIAGNISMQQSTQGVVETLKQFGLAASEAGRVTDVLATASVKSNTNVLELRTALSFVGPVAKAAGLSLEETVATIGLLSDAGVKGSRAGTGLRQAFSKMLSPTGRANKIFKEHGINLKRSNGQLKSMPRLLAELSRAGLDAGEVLDAFGRRAGPAMFALLEASKGSLPKFIRELKNSKGAADDLAETFRTTLTGRIKDLVSSLGLASIAISTDFQKPLANSVFSIRNFINEIVKLATAKGLFKTFAKSSINALKPMTNLFTVLGDMFKDFIKNLTKDDIAVFFEKAKDQVQGLVDALTDTTNINIFIGTAKGLFKIFSSIASLIGFMINMFKSLHPVIQENIAPILLISATILQIVGGVTNVVIFLIAIRALIMSVAGGAALWAGFVAFSVVVAKILLITIVAIGTAVAGVMFVNWAKDLDLVQIASARIVAQWRTLVSLVKLVAISSQAVAKPALLLDKDFRKKVSDARADVSLKAGAVDKAGDLVAQRLQAKKDESEGAETGKAGSKKGNLLTNVLEDVNLQLDAKQLADASAATSSKLLKSSEDIQQLLAVTKGTIGMVGDQISINGKVIKDVQAELRELGIQVGKNKDNRINKPNITVHK
jgi:TP901 family phage tail tape measure protein